MLPASAAGASPSPSSAGFAAVSVYGAFAASSAPLPQPARDSIITADIPNARIDVIFPLFM